MTKQQSETLERITRFLKTRNDLYALALTGSLANGEGLDDEHSDIDLFLVSDHCELYFDDTEWLAAIGPVRATFSEEFKGVGHKARRALFQDGQDVDFVLVDRHTLLKSPDTLPIAREVCGRGLRILWEREGTGAVLSAHGKPPSFPPFPDEQEFLNLTGDFRFHVVWARKKLLRGELLMAVRCVNCYLMARLTLMAEILVRLRSPETDTRYDGRHFERWAPPEILTELRGAYTRYDAEETAAALSRIGTLFEQMAEEVAERLSFMFPPGRSPL